MRNIPVIVLSSSLAITIISVPILYDQYLDKKDALLISEKKLLDLNEETSSLKDDVRKNNEKLEKLKSAKARNSELRDVIKTKDQTLSEFEGKHRELENTFEEKKTTEATLRDELSMKDQTLSEVEEKLSELKNSFEEKKTTEATLRDELSIKDQTLSEVEEKLRELENAFEEKKTIEIKGLLSQLADLRGEKSVVESKLGQMKSTFDTIVSDLKEQLKDKEVSIKAFEERISVSFVDRILFELGKATITPEGREVLEKIGEILKDVEDRQIRVEGHTDNLPILSATRYKFPSNWELSAARAAVVTHYFQEKIGLDPTNLEAVGRSFYEPVASNETEEGRAFDLP